MKRAAPRAPAEHLGVLALPPLDQAPRLFDHNRTLFDQYSLQLLGRSLCDLRCLARHEAVQAARAYFAAQDEPTPSFSTDQPLLLAGHQPDLFHPGVWVKNFALNGLARRLHATPLNLVVDNDVAKSALLRLPGPGLIRPIPFDAWPGATPFEEWRVEDEALFASVPVRVQKETATWPFTPLLASFWQAMTARTKPSPLVGERFAGARRACERRWDCWNLEAPLSRLCQGEAFRWFVLSLVAEAPRLWTIYNEGVRAYRREHGIRSRTHPVPDLTADGDWLEVPLWGWRAGERRRRRLYVRSRSGDWDLRAGEEAWGTLHGPLEQRIERLRALEHEGCKVRSRALTTTWFARLFLADLFMHGLGGGLYDRLTDSLLRRWYGIEPPSFLILSATMKLPFSSDPGLAERCRKLTVLQRDLWYNPQRHVDRAEVKVPLWHTLVEEKIAWADRNPEQPLERRKQFQTVRRINEALRPLVQGQIDQTRIHMQEAQRQRLIQEVQQRRDYPFCLYPEEMLRGFMSGFLHA